MVDWETEARNAKETLERATAICDAESYPEAVRTAIVSGELYLKTMLRKRGIFRESGYPNDKIHDMLRLWERVKSNCGLSATTIVALDDVFIKRGFGKRTLQYIDRTAPNLSHADCADLPSTTYSTEDATAEDFYDEQYALEKISLAKIVERELNSYFTRAPEEEPEEVISMVGGPLGWEWEPVVPSVSTVRITSDEGMTWEWGLAVGNITIPVGGPTGWEWEKHTFKGE